MPSTDAPVSPPKKRTAKKDEQKEPEARSDDDSVNPGFVEKAQEGGKEAEMKTVEEYGPGWYLCIKECQGRIAYKEGREYMLNKNLSPKNFIWKRPA